MTWIIFFKIYLICGLAVSVPMFIYYFGWAYVFYLTPPKRVFKDSKRQLDFNEYKSFMRDFEVEFLGLILYSLILLAVTLFQGAIWPFIVIGSVFKFFTRNSLIETDEEKKEKEEKRSVSRFKFGGTK